ncbi:hypothetical protein Vafri_5040 [Volvox africanus]|uniref:Sas10 C-terminal domain-containing protein n=1 Tax=Volvox africanus TaxID=51714 RepID=A0A8J4AXP0_9CHLO|nr:hypothetical protein Vafri_5040 [Volvox africanus]
MVKLQRRAPPKQPALKGGSLGEEEFLDTDSDDDAFKGKKDKISLNMSDDDEPSDDDGLDVEGVYDLDEEDEGEEDEEDEDEDDDAIIRDAIKRGGRIAELAKQAKMLGQKLKLQHGEDDDEEEEEDVKAPKRGSKGEEADERLWGASKRAYYNADTAEAASDDELLKEEEQEALALQRARAAKLAAADFGLEEDEEEEDEEDEEEVETMGGLASRAMAGGRGRGKVEVEAVARDLSALGDEARLSALMADAPELLSLLQDLQESLAEVRHRVSPLLTELREGGLGTTEGLSYLEAKHLLLLSYCIHIVFYLLLKAEGRPVRDHPVIGRLVELRAYLEKIRPIDKQLSYQIDKLLKAAQIAAATEAQAVAGRTNAAHEGDEAAGPGPGSAAATGSDADVLKYGPRPDALVPKVKARDGAGENGEGSAGELAGVYRPPKINPTSMEMDEQRATGGARLSAQEQRRLKELKAKAKRSDTLRALAAELAGAPEEERAAMAGMDSLAALRTRAKLEARAAVEEDNFIRVPLSKDEAKRLRQQRRAGMSGAGMLEDFGDEVADLVDMTRGVAGTTGAAAARGNALNDLFARQKVSQRFGADHPSLSRRPHGGDEDLPLREPLHERRAKFDASAARRAVKANNDDGSDGAEEYDLGGGAKGTRKRQFSGEEDEFYAQAKANAAARKKARAESHRAPALEPPAPDATTAAARRITNEIQRNRGLTPHRRRDQKNPRKKNRMKFEKAMVRIKGAVQPVREREGVAYGGEASGIKSHVAKSRRL